MNDLITCVTVTQPGRFLMFREAVRDFQYQSHPHRELLVVWSAPPEEMEQQRRFLATMYDDRIRLVELPPTPDGGQRSVGEMRNAALDAARGDVICPWDDDDRHHVDRLKLQYGYLTSRDAFGVHLSAYLYWFVEQHEIHVISTPSAPGLLMYRSSLQRYPDQSQREDRGLFDGLRRNGRRLVPYPNCPTLYLRRFHGQNISGSAHHQRIRKQRSWLTDRVLDNLATIQKALHGYDLLDSLKICSRAGPVADYRP